MEKKSARYEFLEEIGRGGVGTVFKARDTKLNRIVAIKVLEKKNIKPEEIKRFIREAKIIASFKHPNIVTVHDIIDEENRVFFAMDLVEGETLEKLISVKGRFTEKEALSIILKVAKVMQAVHAKEIVHRDIKPSNIMITANRDIKILDFGTAKLEGDTSLTCTGAFVGTVGFAAPEQFNHSKYVDIRSDIYNLGATFYYMLTGEPPYKGAAMEIMYQHCFAPVPSLKDFISITTDALLQKMMAKSPQDRHQNPAELIEHIVRCQGKQMSTLPLWTHSIVSSNILDIKALQEMLYFVPETGKPVLDMASPAWQKLEYGVQIKCAKLYQQSYAKAYGLEIEQTFYAGGASWVMRLIPAGRFLMGPMPEEMASGEIARHAVVIQDPFWLGKYPVSQREWKTVTGQTPWRGQMNSMSTGDCPATFISWNDINNVFLPKLGNEYFLPTEAQWEFACRAGTSTQYFWGKDPEKISIYAWYAKNAYEKGESYAHVAGKKKSNPWGLYDIIGNVWEKCVDLYVKDSSGNSDKSQTGEWKSQNGVLKSSTSSRIPKTDGSKQTSKTQIMLRVERGGAWDTFVSNCRSSKRSFCNPDSKEGTAGFRIARLVPIV